MVTGGILELRKSDIVGNNNLSSTEESQVAEYLRIHYLEKTNGNSLPVRPRNTFYTRVMKRILDIAIASLMSVALSFINRLELAGMRKGLYLSSLEI